RKHTLSKQSSAKTHITIRATGKYAIEPVEESSQRAPAFRFRFQDQRCKRRTQAQRIERRQNNGDRNGYRELLIQPTRNARDERSGHEHGRKHECDANDGSRHFFHGLESSLFRWKAVVNVPLYGLNDDNGVIDDKANSQDKAK